MLLRGWAAGVDHALSAIIAAGQWLVVPVSLLLFLQWPLRDLVWAYSTQANDLAQWLFALYVSLAMTFATRRRAHLAADTVAKLYAAPVRDRIARVALLVCVLPWSLFVLIAGAPMVWRSVSQLEAFPETYNPGYFVIKASALLLAALVLVQAVLDIARPRHDG